MKKVSILLTALVVPVLVVFFLRQFGKNRFDIPVLYQDNLSEWPADCEKPEVLPFYVSDSLAAGSSGKPVLVLFGEPPAEARLRLPQEVDTGVVRIIPLEVSNETLTCRFGASRSAGAVLIDSSRRVRGVYHRLDRDETDKIIMEIKILLNDY